MLSKMMKMCRLHELSEGSDNSLCAKMHRITNGWRILCLNIGNREDRRYQIYYAHVLGISDTYPAAGFVSRGKEPRGADRAGEGATPFDRRPCRLERFPGSDEMPRRCDERALGEHEAAGVARQAAHVLRGTIDGSRW